MDQRSNAHLAVRSPYKHRRMVATAALALVVVIAAVVATMVHAGSTPVAKPSVRSSRHGSASHSGKRRHAAAQPATFLGSDGVEARWVIAENNRPGTTGWKIPPGTPANQIQGFANLNYAAAGQTVQLYVSTPSPTLRVVAYRMGWYGGTGAREVWSSSVVAGHQQPACPLTTGVNMVSCDNWTPSLSMPVTGAFVQGDYLLKLTGSGGQEGYIPLVIWDPTSQATYLLVARTFTEQAWNTYGGYSFYQGEGPCPPGSGSYPVCNRARVVSLDRPYGSGYGASDFFGNEFPLVEFCEEHGLDVTYVTDVTLDAYPQIALHHKVLLSLGHDEAWSYNEREAAQTAEAHGVNVVFFGAAAVLRHVRLQSSLLGPDREEVDYRDSSEDPLNGQGNPNQVTGNTWSSPPTSWSEIPFVGENYSGYLTGTNTVPFVVYDSSAWIFKGTGLTDGSQIPGVIASDIDHQSPGEPANLQVLGHSPIPLPLIYTNQGTWGNQTYSDMTYYTDPQSHAGVLDTGTVNWIYSMRPCPTPVASCPALTVQKITGNLLWLFGQGPAGVSTPSVGNGAAVQPAGS
jgi:hypothetical protein